MGKAYAAFISHLGKRLFGERPALPSASLATTEEEIPRYPPFMKGLPTAPVDRILSTQTELIKAIEQALALPDDLYQTIALPVIARYAAFSHLLPASESHHHRGAGGLFRHGLEVAHWASMAAQGCLFATQATPRERKSQELRWRLAVCFAGLLHDIGKPVSDMAVVDRQGKHIWNPCDENLTDWAAQNGIDRYFLRWRENRHKRHEQFSALVIERVLTRESRTYILAPGPDIMQAMLETIHGLDRGAKLYELVNAADRKSVERDLKTHYHSVDSAMGMPVEKYLFDAMRRLIKSGKWFANDKGARVWRFREGVHIVWRTGAQDIVELLAKDKVPGIPRDEDTLADILIERGLAIPKRLPDGGYYRYWRMQPQGLDVTLYMLRLASAELIFSNEPPVVVEGLEVAAEAETVVVSESKPDSAKAETSLHTPIKPASDSAPPIELPVMAINQTPNINAVNTAQKLILPDQPIKLNTDDTSSAPQIDKTLPFQSKLAELQNGKIHVKLTNAKLTANNTTAKKPKRSSNTAKTESDIELGGTQLSQPDNIDMARSWLQNQGLAGEWLLQIITEINQARWRLNTDVHEANGKVLLPFPDTALKLNIDPNLFIKTLEEKGWLVTDVLSPMRKVQVINQVRGVLLASEPSGFLKQLLPAPSLPAPSVLQAQQPTSPEQLAPTKNKRPKTLSSKAEMAEKGHEQNPSSVTDEPSLPEAEPPKTTADKPAQSELADTTPTKPKSIPETTAIIPDDSRLILTFIDHLRNQPQSATNSKDNGWITVEDTDINQFLVLHPKLKRSTLMREMSHNKQNCLMDDRSIKVKIKP